MDEQESKPSQKRRRRPSSRVPKTGDEPELIWTSMAQFALGVDHRGRKLLVSVSPVPFEEQWGVLAVETAKDIKTPDDVFNDHSHKTIGSYDSPAKAFAAAESYARAWFHGHKSTQSDEQCGCEEISEAVPVHRDVLDVIDCEFEDDLPAPSLCCCGHVHRAACPDLGCNCSGYHPYNADHGDPR